LSQDAVSKVFASLALEGRGFSADEKRFHDALLHFAKVTDSLEIEKTGEDVKIILGGDRGPDLLPGALTRPAGRPRRQAGGPRALVSLDDRRLREPLLLLSVYDRVPVQP
jgi:hypothetical protein